MAQNFRLSILPNKRQSYDLSQFSESNTPLHDVGVIQNNMLSEQSGNGTPQNGQQFSAASNQLNGPSAKKYSIQEHSSKNLQKNHKDFWLCIGLMSIFTLIAIAGILIVEFRVSDKPKENNATNTSSGVLNYSTTEMDYDITTEIIIVPSSIDQNETQITNNTLR